MCVCGGGYNECTSNNLKYNYKFVLYNINFNYIRLFRFIDFSNLNVRRPFPQKSADGGEEPFQHFVPALGLSAFFCSTSLAAGRRR